MTDNPQTTIFDRLAAKYEPRSDCKNAHILAFMLGLVLFGFSIGGLVALHG